MKSKTALITGASKGIGKSFAYIHAANNGDLVLVARSKDKLLLLKEELEVKYLDIRIEIIVQDLTALNSASEIYNEVKKNNIQVDYLINNAGIGEFGLFEDTNWSRLSEMIDLNIKTLTHLCHLFLPEMVARKHGCILNISSTAAFQPGPMMAVYFATKSYVLNFSEALNNEVHDTGVSVTAYCPGPTDTYFMEDSKMKNSKLVKNRRLPSSDTVAFTGYKAMLRSKPVKIYGLLNNLLAFSVRLIPRKWVVYISSKMQA